MRVNKDDQRNIYVNPTNYTARTRARLCSSMALQPRLGLLSKWRSRDDIADSAAIVVIGCDLGRGGAFRIARGTAPLGRCRARGRALSGGMYSVYNCAHSISNSAAWNRRVLI